MQLNEFQLDSPQGLAISALGSFPNVEIEIGDERNIAEKVAELDAKDLIFISHQRYNSSVELRNLFDNDCLSSVCIVKG